MDKFDAYFQRADLDRDGRISGAEAVSFFQGSNLSQQVLAQIWMHADQAHTGFLGRKEFYNALKLVTVAQSKRELTPDIVKAALYGPAAAKIPAPQINLAAIPSPQISSMAAAPAPQISVSRPQQMNASPASQLSMAAPASSQHPGFRGQAAPNANMNQQYFPSQQNQFSRAPQIMPVVSSSQPPSTNISSDGLVGRSVGAPVGVTAPYRGLGPLTPSTAPIPQNILPTSSSPAAKDAKTTSASVNGFPSDTFFGDDVFSAKPSPVVKQDSLAPTYSTTSRSASSAALPPHPPVKFGSVDSLHSAFRMQPPDGQIQRTQSLTNPNQRGLAQTSSFGSSRNSVGVVNSASNPSLASWPRMTPSDVQKYTKVFVEVDTDRDGKITGEQARNLFLSWRLPREVLKQVWDLSDQDNDSMLSLKEFCIALYLMERFREGRPLPAVLPNNILSDETLLPNASYGNANSGTTPGGLRPQQMMSASRPLAPGTGFRPPLQVSASHLDSPLQQSYPQNSQVPMMENPLPSHHSHAEQNSKFQAATTTEKKVEAMENGILDSREKVEFYRTKMQDLVLYKSRCDNRLNEITERASADKREAELLAKKYEEKYKQVAEIASKLAIEEAKFCEIQERKTELHQAILKIEQGGSADGILQVRADRIQSDVEELMKVLAEFCKKHGLDVKSSALIELPIGWQRGIQEGSAEWDEDWDKFEDEGFSFATDVALGGQNIISSPKQTSKSLSKSDDKSEKSLGTGESAYAQSEEDLTSSPLGSPDKTTLDSPFQEFSDTHSRKSTEVDVDNHGNFVEPSWGTFDNNDDTDSVWGFNPASTKDSVLERPRENYFFGSDDPSSDQISVESPSADSMFQKKSPFTFADSVPGTPASRAGNSPRYSEAGDHFFDNYSRFDSFSMHEGGSAAPGTLTRFDSINSSRDFGHSKGFSSSPGRETFTRFDSINSSRDFGHSKGFPSSPGRETFTRFDSINSSRGFTFDETDPFGSTGPFKVSSESGTPKNSENWRSF